MGRRRRMRAGIKQNAAGDVRFKEYDPARGDEVDTRRKPDERMAWERDEDAGWESGVTHTVYCTHSGEQPCMFIRGAAVHATTEFRFKDDGSHSLVLDCTGWTKKKALVVPQGFERLNEFYYAPANVISIPWDDFSEPPLSSGFWTALIDFFKQGDKVTVFCQGAHGRTGTALTCMLLAANRGMSAANALAIIRKAHCASAVESASQTEYVNAVAEQYGGKGDAVYVSKYVTTPTYPNVYAGTAAVLPSKPDAICKSCQAELYGNFKVMPNGDKMCTFCYSMGEGA